MNQQLMMDQGMMLKIFGCLFTQDAAFWQPYSHPKIYRPQMVTIKYQSLHRMPQVYGVLGTPKQNPAGIFQFTGSRTYPFMFVLNKAVPIWRHIGLRVILLMLELDWKNGGKINIGKRAIHTCSVVPLMNVTMSPDFAYSNCAMHLTSNRS